MDQASLYATEARCTQEAMPQCQAHCPLNVDVRTFMGHMADNNMPEARKVLERHMPLPGILAHICDHPCENACLRRDLGGSLATQSLESVCMSATQKQGKGFMRPPKTKRVAVFGNGLAGLVAAFELAKKSWPVTIFFEGSNPEAFLLAQFSNLTATHTHEEFTQLAKQHVSFAPASLSTTFFIETMHTYDATFVDAHAAPQIFEHLGSLPDPLTGHIKENICAGGILQTSPTGDTYPSTSTQAAQGRQAALSIERILGGIDPHAGRDQAQSTLHTPLDGILPLHPIVPASQTYTLEETAQEAQRCIQCQCMQCVKHCLYLQKHGSFPRAYTRQIYNNASIVKGEHRANTLINGCTLCGQCTEICPERFSMAELCLEARQDMVERKYMPPSAHAFALDDLHAATHAPATLFMGSTGHSDTDYAFFPGCQLSGARWRQVLDVYAFLKSHISVGLMLTCCGIPARWAGHEDLVTETAEYIVLQWNKLGQPTLIMACASCLQFFKEVMPHIPCVSLWEVLYEHREHMTAVDQQNTLGETKTCTIHDPCSARHNKAWHNATRLLAEHCGVHCVESPYNKNIAHCCGYGGLVWCAQPDLAQDITKNLAHTLGEHTGLASCIMCRDRLIQSDKSCLHFFDILPIFTDNTHNEHKPPPSLSAKRANRVRLVREIMNIYGTATVVQDAYGIREGLPLRLLTNCSSLRIEPELLTELERKHILHQDAAAAVHAVEAHKRRFLEKESGHYVGAWCSGHVTFWVRYSKDTPDSYQLHDAWCHRMSVPNAPPDNGE